MFLSGYEGSNPFPRTSLAYLYPTIIGCHYIHKCGLYNYLNLEAINKNLKMKLDSIEDVQRLIDDKIGGSLTLEYKRELDKNNKDIAKDISAFANTKGGTIIYGLEESDGVPVAVSWIKGKALKERIENIALSAIQPEITDLKITRISKSGKDNGSLLVVEIPESLSGSHKWQALIRYHPTFSPPLCLASAIVY